MASLAWLDSTLYDALPYCVVTLSLILTFKYLRFPDVTVSASFVLGAAVAAVAIVHWHLPGWAALLLGFVAGAGAGAMTAAIHVLLGIEPIVASIISAFAVFAVNQTLLRPTLPYGAAKTFLTWAESIDRGFDLGRIPWHPGSIALFAVVVVAVKVGIDWMLASEVGLALRALEDPDSGERVLSRLGIRPGAIKLMGLTIGNGLVGVSGALISMKEGAANLHRGLDILITGLIAYLLGQALASRRKGKPFLRPTTAAIVGAIIYFSLVTISYQVGVPTEFTRLVLAVLVAVSIGRLEWRRRSESRTAQSADAAPDGLDSAVSNVSFQYPLSDLPILSGVNLTFHAGRITRLTGPNGSGKTTLLRLIAGHFSPLQSGRIVVAGKDLTDSPDQRLEAVRYVDQNPARSVVRTTGVVEFLSLCMVTGRPSLFRRAVTTAATARVRSTLVTHGFPEAILAKHGSALSGGETQLVNLLGFLVEPRSPALVLLDEPLNGLDHANRVRMTGLLRLLRSRGAAIVVVSHDSHDLGIDEVVSLGSSSSEDDGSKQQRSVLAAPHA